jgi:ribonucleoside-diphosphate reductase alpha chain
LGISFITVNQDPEGNPFEVFVTIGKAGSEVAAMAEALGRLISTTLRFGNHLPARERARGIMEQLQGIGGGKSVGFGINKVKSLPDAVAKALGMHFGLIETQEESKQLSILRDLCPKCGEATFVFEEGCKKCYGCGYSEC